MYRSPARLIVPLALAFSLAAPAVSVATDAATLQSDLVSIQNGKMTINDVRVCTSGSGSAAKTKQIQISAEGSTDGSLSRDRFVALYATMSALSSRRRASARAPSP